MFQQNLSVFLIGICVILMFFLAITDSLSKRRKNILFMMVFSSMILVISLSPNLPIGANYHHERCDGKGYPEGLKGEKIPENLIEQGEV